MFADRLREMRIQRNISQAELGEAIGMSQATVTSWENGTRKPTIETIVQLAQFFGCSTDYLLCADTEESQDEAMVIREKLRRKPEFRMLFSAADRATPDHILAAAAMLKSLEPKEYDE